MVYITESFAKLSDMSCGENGRNQIGFLARLIYSFASEKTSETNQKGCLVRAQETYFSTWTTMKY